MDDNYLQFGIPGPPYWAVRIPLVEDLEEQDVIVARAMNAAQLLANAYYQAFGGEPSPEPAPRPQQRPAPQPAQRTNGAAQRAPQRQAAPPRRAAGAPTLDPQLIIQGFCPSHPSVAALPSLPKYQEVEMGEDGYERYAKYFCPGKENGTGQNHQLFARQLVGAQEPDDTPF